MLLSSLIEQLELSSENQKQAEIKKIFFNLLTDTNNYKHYILQKKAESTSLKIAYIELMLNFLKQIVSLQLSNMFLTKLN